MTIKEFLSLPKPDQAIEAAKVLVPKPWKHELVSDDSFSDLCSCSKCSLRGYVSEGVFGHSCSVPDPIRRLGNMEKCIWILDSTEEFWETECGKAFCFIDGSPKYNEMKFCPYCGKILETDE